MNKAAYIFAAWLMMTASVFPQDTAGVAMPRAIDYPVGDLERLYRALDEAGTELDPLKMRQMLQKASEAAAGLPDLISVDVSYSSPGEDDGAFHMDSSSVNIQWVKNDVRRLAREEVLDSSHVRVVRDRLGGLLQSIDDRSEYSLERNDEPYAERIRTLLQRPEFREKENRNLLSEALRKLLTWLAELLGRLFGESQQPRVEMPPIDFSAFGKILLTIVYAAGAAVLFWLIRWGIVFFRKRHPGGAGPGARGFGDLLEPGESTAPDEHRRLADACAAEGNYRKAIRHLFLSIILFLDHENIVRYHRQWTNTEFLRAIRNHEKEWIRGLDFSLANVTATFDRKWYGLEAASDADYQQCVGAWDDICARVERSAAV